MNGVSEFREYLLFFAAFFIFGLFLASRILLLTSFVPLFIFLFGNFLSNTEIKGMRKHSQTRVSIGETFDVQASGIVSGGLGTVILHEELPEAFELVEGSNYKALWKGFGSKQFKFHYKVRCIKRGVYYFKGLKWEFIPIFGLRQPMKGIIGESNELTVSTRLFHVQKIRVPHKFSVVSNPLQGITRIGSLSTDFRDIRQYMPGDPFKLINWKATARMSTQIENLPLINEYEREGKFCVWIFLDAHQDMRFGTSVENAFEYSVEATINLSYLLLNKGFLLGLYIYNDLEETFYPDVGKQQFIKIADRLLTLYSVEKGIQFVTMETLPEAMEMNRTLLTSLSPLIIVITHLTHKNIGEIIHSIRKVSAYNRKKYSTKTIIINVLPYDLIQKKNMIEELTARMLETKSKKLSDRLRALGIVVLDWNPRKESFRSVLAKNLWVMLS